jgi:hypothetical protein
VGDSIGQARAVNKIGKVEADLGNQQDALEGYIVAKGDEVLPPVQTPASEYLLFHFLNAATAWRASQNPGYGVISQTTPQPVLSQIPPAPVPP